MTAPVTINNVMTLKIMHFDPELDLAIEGSDEIGSIEDFERVHLYLGVGSGARTSGEVVYDQSRRAVRQALNEVLRIARDIEQANAAQAPVDSHLAIFERIRAFASRYGTLWGVAIPDRLPRNMEARKIDGSMLEWYREVLTLLDVYELVPVASGKRDDRAIRGRIGHEEHQGKVAVFTSRIGEKFGLATNSRKIVVQPPWEPSPQVVEPWKLVHGDSSALAWVILTTICKHRLDHRLNIGFHPSARNSLAITPDGIGPTLFARLWLDALVQETVLDMVRLCQHPRCENRIPERARADAQYCSNTCQKADRRRIQRLAQAHA